MESQGKAQVSPEDQAKYDKLVGLLADKPAGMDVKEYLMHRHDAETAPKANDPVLIGAVELLTAAIRNDPSLYIAYQANIAMAFVDTVSEHAPDMDENDRDTMHYIANEGAKRFLNLWINFSR